MAEETPAKETPAKEAKAPKTETKQHPGVEIKFASGLVYRDNA